MMFITIRQKDIELSHGVMDIPFSIEKPYYCRVLYVAIVTAPLCPVGKVLAWQAEDRGFKSLTFQAIFSSFL